MAPFRPALCCHRLEEICHRTLVHVLLRVQRQPTTIRGTCISHVYIYGKSELRVWGKEGVRWKGSFPLKVSRVPPPCPFVRTSRGESSPISPSHFRPGVRPPEKVRRIYAHRVLVCLIQDWGHACIALSETALTHAEPLWRNFTGVGWANCGFLRCLCQPSLQPGGQGYSHTVSSSCARFRGDCVPERVFASLWC